MSLARTACAAALLSPLYLHMLPGVQLHCNQGNCTPYRSGYATTGCKGLRCRLPARQHNHAATMGPVDRSVGPARVGGDVPAACRIRVQQSRHRSRLSHGRIPRLPWLEGPRFCPLWPALAAVTATAFCAIDLRGQ
jgi:hypothetical protein